MTEWQAQHKFPPVLLITGQEGIGKRAIAFYLAQWILCETPQGIEPCYHCASCQKMLAGNSVDFTEMTPESEDESGSLKIEQFRKLKASAGFSTQEGAHKIILIPHADRMTLQAANSILKLLEEPPAGWIFFLTAADPTLMLPTIVSRCQTLRLKPFSMAEIEELLKSSGVEPTRIKMSAQWSQGSLDRALHFSQDQIWEQRQRVLHFLREPAAVLHPLVDWATQENTHLGVLIDLLEQFLSDFILWTATPSAEEEDSLASHRWLNSDATDDLKFHASQILKKFGSVKLARSFWIAQTERLAQARQDSLTPVNRKLLTQDLLFPFIDAMRGVRS